MIRNFEEVSFDQIAWSSAESRVTWRRVPPLLRLSVREVGVLNPLIVAETALPDRFSIVTGWLRFEAAREVGENSVPCHIYRSFPPKILLLISIFDNLGHRHLNVVEQGLVLSKLAEFYTEEEIRRTFVPILGLQHLSRNWNPLIEVTTLHEDLQWAIADGDLSPEAAKALAAIPLGHSQHVLRLLRSIPAPPVAQTQIAQGFCELLEKKDVSPLEVIQDEGWSQIAPHSDPSEPEKRTEEDLLKLEMDLAAPPALFAGRRKASPVAQGRNVLAPGERVSAVQERRQRIKSKGTVDLPACTYETVYIALQRRLGTKLKKGSMSTLLPEGARISSSRSTGARRLEVSFETSDELRTILKHVLDAEERGALQSLLGRA